MATKYPIIKHRAFYKTLTCFISANNEYIFQKFLPDTCGPQFNVIQQINDIERSKCRYIFH